jgi:proteic killer suppression protein
MELSAADSLADISRLPPARRHELVGDRKGVFSVDLEHPFRLLFIPANDPLPLNSQGGINLSEVTEVEIIGIEDTH